jgi:2,3-bisphosphoglycerate-independent phosphoglycerate mutase
MSTPKRSSEPFRGKIGVVIIDGAADHPLAELDDQTPLEAAAVPAMDRLARDGLVAQARCIPDEMEAGSDVAIMALLGYDPRKYHTGRAPIEAAAQGLRTRDGQWIFRCNLVTVADGKMRDHSGGGISTAKAEALIEALNEDLRDEPVRFFPGVSYRNLMVLDGDATGVRTTPPHDIRDQPFDRHLPQGPGAELLKRVFERSREIFARLDAGAANAAWLWGQGVPARLDAFRDRYGLRGVMICAVDLVAGLANLMGWPRVPVVGATGNIDTNYAGKGRAAVETVDDYDLVCVHIEAPDEAGHQGDAREKKQSLERVDQEIVAPLLARLQREPWWRMLVMPDHPTPCAVKTHTREPVPLALGGSDVKPGPGLRLTEAEALRSGFRLADSGLIMELLTGRAPPSVI